METLRRIVNSDIVNEFIPLPQSFMNKQIEVIMSPIVSREEIQKLDMGLIDDMLKGSITQSLIGAIELKNISLKDIRNERLSKYESID
jgi:hypothetical protein